MKVQYFEERKLTCPIFLCQEDVLFPGQMDHYEVISQEADKAIEKAYSEDVEILMIYRIQWEEEDKGLEDYSLFGSLAKVRQIFRFPNGQVKALLEAKKRARLDRIVGQSPFYTGEITAFAYLPEQLEEDEKLKVLLRLTAETAEEFFEKYTQIPSLFYKAALNEEDPEDLSNTISSYLSLKVKEALDLLSCLEFKERYEKIQALLHVLTEAFQLKSEIVEKATEKMNQTQTEYMLREQMNIIKEKLSEAGSDEDADGYYQSILELHLPKEDEEMLLKEVEKLDYITPMSPDYSVTKAYLDTVLDLPWGEFTEDVKDLKESKKILDKNHYGLEDVKERILEFLAVRQLREDSKGSILCLVGPPGVGKTSISRSIAKAIGREFTSIRLGGVTDESEIRGHRRTYVGSMPGRIISSMTSSKSMNPVFLLDEVDKMGADFRGDPASALLEVLDPEQNFEFKDRYLEIPFDLSKVLFITTANSMDTIPAALQDRMEVIHVSSYTELEKFQIAKSFLVPKQMEENGLNKDQLRFTDGALKAIVESYTREAGVRELERQIGKACRKVAKKIVDGEENIVISKRNLHDILGEILYRKEDVQKEPQIGVVNGLAWTQSGGEILTIESNLMEGHGNLQTTGSLGNVMKESCQTTISYIRANAKRYAIDSSFYMNKDIHIHMPEGAVPKDGPSAGVSLATAVVSVLTNRPIRHDLAMTGEITLTGKVLPIGGVKEKVLAANRYKIDKIILPKENIRDLKEVDEEVTKLMEIYPVEHIDEVLRLALLDSVQIEQSVVFERKDIPSPMGFAR